MSPGKGETDVCEYIYTYIYIYIYIYISVVFIKSMSNFIIFLKMFFVFISILKNLNTVKVFINLSSKTSELFKQALIFKKVKFR